MDLRADLLSKSDAGLIPFTYCGHDLGQRDPFPANVHVSALTIQASCAICLSPVALAGLIWMTASDAQQRLGWAIAPSDTVTDGSGPSSRRLRNEQAIDG